MSKRRAETAWERWELSTLDDGFTPLAPPPRLSAPSAAPQTPPPAEEPAAPPPPAGPSEEELAQIREQAYQAAYTEGHEAGFAAGHEAGHTQGLTESRAQGEAMTAQFLALNRQLDEALEALTPTLSAEISALAVEIARRIMAQTLKTQPETIVGVVQAALAQLPLQHSHIHLSPADAALVREYAGDQLSHAGHRIQEDQRLQAGEVRIDAGSTMIDGTLTSRWAQVMDSLGFDADWKPEVRQSLPGDATPAGDKP